MGQACKKIPQDHSDLHLVQHLVRLHYVSDIILEPLGRAYVHNTGTVCVALSTAGGSMKHCHQHRRFTVLDRTTSSRLFPSRCGVFQLCLRTRLLLIVVVTLRPNCRTGDVLNIQTEN